MRFRSMMVAGIVAAGLSLAPAGVQAAALVNGSFEDIGEGWLLDPALLSISDTISHVDASNVATKHYKPIDGYMFAVMYADQPEGDAAAGPPLDAKRVSQTFATDGGWISGYAAFFSSETPDNNDYASVRVYNGVDVDFELFRSNVVDIQPLGYTPWTRFYRQLGAGQYTVEAAIGNGTNNFNTSVLIMDHFAVTATIPEPATWAMMILGFFGMGAMLRRRQSDLAGAKA